MSDDVKGLDRRRFLELGAAGAAFLSLGEARSEDRPTPDTGGTPVAVARMDPARSYVRVPGLLQRHLASRDAAAWQEIAAAIDATYEQLGHAMAALDGETGFGALVKSRVEHGQRLLFKPNLVTTACIDPVSHGPFMGSAACTEWPFIAAAMRWFHDHLGISYHRMALGEAATSMALFASLATTLNPARQPVTTEGLIEGRTGDFIFGWGFSFARKYLAERLPPGATDDPMRGYTESVAGTYLPPGLAGDRLMVYDLNRVSDDPAKGREVPVPDGVNFRSIILHKAIVGGDPTDPEDRNAYPGAVLVNVPKLKIHAISLLTNAIKNLGIGLYPMEAARNGGTDWEYASPRGPIPAMKEPIPHQVWVPDLDHDTGLVRRDEGGRYRVRRTGGLPATMIDIVKAVATQDVLMVHVVDGIEAINHSHGGGGTKVPEGLVVAALDPVAADTLCARYLFCNVGLEEALASGITDRTGGCFPQRVPVAVAEDGLIVTRTGYDCPLDRDRTFEQAERRGLGQRRYHVVGRDATNGRRLVSLHGHLGTLDDQGRFTDVVTGTLYFATSKMAWDLQRTALSYMEASDRLTGSSWKRAFLQAYDEDGDGAVTYEEFGRNGTAHPGMYMFACSGAVAGRDPVARIRLSFAASAISLRNSRVEWNAEGHDLFGDRLYGRACLAAYRMSQRPASAADAAGDKPGAVGGGVWPTFEQAHEAVLRNDLRELYGEALAYADVTLNRAALIGSPLAEDFRAAVGRYVTGVTSGASRPLDFKLMIPQGTARLFDPGLPNLEETEDRAQMWTLRLAGGSEVLPGPKPFAVSTRVESRTT